MSGAVSPRTRVFLHGTGDYVRARWLCRSVARSVVMPGVRGIDVRTVRCPLGGYGLCRATDGERENFRARTFKHPRPRVPVPCDTPKRRPVG